MWSKQGEDRPSADPGLEGRQPGNSGNRQQRRLSTRASPPSCGVVAYSDQLLLSAYSQRVGGNCHSDNFIASENGDIYFFSPEQLDGTRGIPNQENLYDYRNGQVQYVTTLTTGSVLHCYGNRTTGYLHRAARSCSMQVSPDDSHMAFVTASPVTQYNNAGHLEMYTYDPSTAKVVCVSCIPSGAPPTSDVEASQDGLFMTNDGRTFFTHRTMPWSTAIPTRRRMSTSTSTAVRS